MLSILWINTNQVESMQIHLLSTSLTTANVRQLGKKSILVSKHLSLLKTWLLAKNFTVKLSALFRPKTTQGKNERIKTELLFYIFKTVVTFINLYWLVVKCETYNTLTWRSWYFKTRFLKIFVLVFLFSPTFRQAKINCPHSPTSATAGDCWPFDRCQLMIILHSAYDQDEVDWDFQFILSW